MHALYLTLTTLLAATAVVAQGNPGIPSCAFDCVKGYGGCGQFDYKCICSNKPYIANLACCVGKSCDKADQETTLKFANALCAGQQVSDLPQSATCASTSSGASATGTASSSSGTASSSSGSSSGATTTPASTAGASSASASASSAAAASASAGAAAMNKMEGLGMGMVVAGIVAAL